MYCNVGNSIFLKKFVAIALSLLLCQPTLAQTAENQMMSFEGSLTDTSGNAINLQSQQLFFYISAMDDAGEKCILFAESSSTAGDAEGTILHKFGTGSAITSPVSFNHVLSNSVFTGDASGIKADGSGIGCLVTNANSRIADVYSSVLSVQASVTLASVPYSYVANNSLKLNGKSDTDFVLAASVSGGTTGQILSRSGTNGFAWINPPVATSGTQLATTNNLSDLTSATVARANLELGGLATLNSINLASHVTGILPEANIPAFTGDVFSNQSDNFITVTKLRGQPISTLTPVSGHILTHDGTQWTPMAPNFIRTGGDILTGTYGIDGGLGVASTTTTNADVIPLLAIRRLTSHAANGANGLGSMLLFEAENSAGNNVAQAGILSRWTSAVTATEQSQLEFQTRFNTAMQTRMAITAGGKVGIGTTSPNALLDVQGTIKVGTNGAASSCSSIEGGAMRFNNNQLEFCNGTLWQPAGYWTQDAVGIYSNSNLALGTTPSSSSRMTVQTSGNQLAYFKQNSTNQDGILIDVAGNSASNYGLVVFSNGVTQFAVKNDNKVGIGTFAPQATLHVSGSTFVDGNAVISGTIQLRSPASLATNCSLSEEGSQRYNKNLKTMEYCDGANWQGVNGLTYCDGGYTLVGTPGAVGAYCVENTADMADYLSARSSCHGRIPSRKTNVKICTSAQLDRICESGSLPADFMGTAATWTSDTFSGNWPSTILYSTASGTCTLTYDGSVSGWPTNAGRVISSDNATTSHKYRCCYE